MECAGTPRGDGAGERVHASPGQLRRKQAVQRWPRADSTRGLCSISTRVALTRTECSTWRNFQPSFVYNCGCKQIHVARHVSRSRASRNSVLYCMSQFKSIRRRMPLREKVLLGHFLSLSELARVRGVSTKKLSAYAQDRERNGFPIWDKKVRLADFDAWYRRQISFEIPAPVDTSLARQSPATLPRSDGNKPHGPQPNCDSTPSLQPFR